MQDAVLTHSLLLTHTAFDCCARLREGKKRKSEISHFISNKYGEENFPVVVSVQ